VEHRRSSEPRFAGGANRAPGEHRASARNNEGAREQSDGYETEAPHTPGKTEFKLIPIHAILDSPVPKKVAVARRPRSLVEEIISRHK
jgi:hypothetical protein